MTFIEATTAVSGCGFIDGVTCYQVTKDILATLLTLVTILATLAIASEQWKRQHLNSIDQQKHKIEQDTKTEFFRIFNAKMDLAIAKLRSAYLELVDEKIYKNVDSKSQQYGEFMARMNSDIFSSVDEITTLLERYEVINAKLLRVARYCFYHEMGKIEEIVFSSKERLDIEALLNYAQNLMFYLSDLNVSLQNTIYGPIFEQTVQHRNSYSKTPIVLSDDKENLEKLENYLLYETFWGKKMQRLQEAEKAEHAKPEAKKP